MIGWGWRQRGKGNHSRCSAKELGMRLRGLPLKDWEETHEELQSAYLCFCLARLLS